MNLKNFLPHLVALAAFIIIPCIYFSPVVSGDKMIRQGDVSQHQGMSKEIADYRKSHNGEEPLWTNSMFGGMPAYQISVIYGANLMVHVDQLMQLYLPHPANLVLLYFIGFYILMLCLRINPWVGLIASLAYGFSSFFFIIIEAGHNSQAHALGYVPALVGAVILTFRGNAFLGAGLTALFGALELYCNHIQITYYFVMVIGIIMLFEFYTAFKSGALKKFFFSCALLIVAAGLSILPNITNLWATYEYGKFSTRGKTELTIKADGSSNKDIASSGLDKDYATQWSYGIGETFTLIIPNYKGGASEALGNYKDAMEKIDPQYRRDVGGAFQAYFGNQPFTSGPIYAGAIIVFLALMSLFIVQDRLKWALLVATILGIMLSWGKNFMGLTNFFFDFVPGYNKFRVVTMILVIAEFTLPLLAALAMNELVERIKSGDQEFNFQLLKKKLSSKTILFVSAGIIGGFALLVYLSPGMFNKFQSQNELEMRIQQELQNNPDVSRAQVEGFFAPLMEQVESARKAIVKSDAIRTVIFILLSAGAILLYFRKTLSRELLIAALGIFILADLWPVAARYLNKNNFVPKSTTIAPFTKSKADEFILEDKALNYRVLNLTVSPFNDASTSYFHKSIGGYHGAKLKRYMELIDFHIDTDIQTLYKGLRSGGLTDSMLQATFEKTKVLNMLNCKYVIGNADAPPLMNRQAYGNAWFVSKIKWVENADEEITTLGKESVRWSAVVNKKFADQAKDLSFEKDTTAYIRLKSYEPNYLVYESNAKQARTAVFSEIYYPKGWNAYVDGQLSPHFCANYVLRAMQIPAGTHKIEFKFEPEVFSKGEKIAGIGSIIVLLFAFGSAFLAWKKKA